MNDEKPSHEPLTWLDWLKVIGAIILIIVVIVGTGWILVYGFGSALTTMYSTHFPVHFTNGTTADRTDLGIDGEADCNELWICYRSRGCHDMDHYEQHHFCGEVRV